MLKNLLNDVKTVRTSLELEI